MNNVFNVNVSSETLNEVFGFRTCALIFMYSSPEKLSNWRRINQNVRNSLPLDDDERKFIDSIKKVISSSRTTGVDYVYRGYTTSIPYLISEGFLKKDLTCNCNNTVVLKGLISTSYLIEIAEYFADKNLSKERNVEVVLRISFNNKIPSIPIMSIAYTPEEKEILLHDLKIVVESSESKDGILYFNCRAIA